MSTLVTRLYDDPTHADAVIATLKSDGFPDDAMTLIEQSGSSSAEDKIVAAGVSASVAQQYAQHLTSKRALLVVRAPFVPFGAARRAIEVADQYPSTNAGVSNENLNVPEQPDERLFLSILGSHRLFLTAPYDVKNNLKPRGLSAAFRIPVLSERGKRMRPAVTQRAHIFPIRQMRHHRTTNRKLLIDRFFAAFALPHLWRRKPSANVGSWRITN